MKISLTITLMLVSIVLIAPSALAQKGVGDQEGIVRQGITPDLVPLAGVILEIKIGPCEMTTGPSTTGAHVILKSDDDRTLNIHLGPEVEVGDLLPVLNVGERLTVLGYRTDQLPDDAYVAKEVVVGERTFILRDDDLKPRWAVGVKPRRGRNW